MPKKPTSINLSPLEDIFDVESATADADERITELPLSEIHAFKGHPFQVRDDEEMDALVDSVKQNGILVPLIVRSRAAGGYELIAGHRRKRAAELAGLSTVPVDIRDVDDDTAILMMVSTNIQRQRVLPSGRAFAYKMMVEAAKRKAGRKRNYSQVGNNFIGTVSSKQVADELGISKNQIYRFVRLTFLIDAFLALVDNDRLPMNTAVELSYLCPDEQANAFSIMTEERMKPSMAQATQLKEESQARPLTRSDLLSFLTVEKTPEPRIRLAKAIYTRYFPSGYTPEEAENVILSLLEEWAQNQKE